MWLVTVRMSLRRIIAILALSAAPLPVSAVLITNLNDELDDATHFITSELDLVNNGNSTVSLVHTNTAPPNDQTALWGKDGTDIHLVLSPDSRFNVWAVESVISGTITGKWGFDVVWFDASDSYIGQANYQSATDTTGLHVYFITSSVPVGAVSWAAQFRVFDQAGNQPLVAGYGFTFDRLQAYAIPEPSVLGLGLMGGVIAYSIRRRREKKRV